MTTILDEKQLEVNKDLDKKLKSELLTIGESLQCAGEYNLLVEVVWSALHYLKANPSKSTNEAIEFGFNEWVK